MKRVAWLVLLMSASAGAHPCLDDPSLERVAACFEGLSLRDRLIGVRDSADALISRLTGDQFEFAVRLYDPKASMSVDEATEIYRQLESRVEKAMSEAQGQGKRLILIGGESHIDRTALMMGRMLISIGRRMGAERIGWETALESYQTPAPDSVHYRGLLEQVGIAYDHREEWPSEKEPESGNYLGGTRANQEFAIWDLMRGAPLDPKAELCLSPDCWFLTQGRVAPGLSLFAADPMFWHWARSSDYFGYFGSREPGMAATLVDQALASPPGVPVVAIYGYGHFKGITEELARTGRQDEILLKTVGFIQSMGLYNPDLLGQLPESNRRELYNLEHSLLSEDGNLFAGKAGPRTAREALEWAAEAERRVHPR